MCVQYHGGAQYRGGVQYCGEYIEYCGGVQYHGGYHDKCGVFSTMWVFSIVGDIMSTVGAILSIVQDFQYRGGYHGAHGGYHEYRGGCSVLWGKSFVI